MKVCGLIAEFNPFHNGHQIYLRKAKELTGADFYILALSPNFVQRGEPAIISKEERAKIAIENGVDLVIEIPTIYTLENADIYAFAALSMLEDIGCDDVVFGTESGDSETFIKKFKNKDFGSPRMDEIVSRYLKEGYSYPKAKALAMEEINDFYLENPNDILAYSYLKIIDKYNLKIKPLCYQRLRGEDDEFSSAIKIRNCLKDKRDTHPDLHYLDDYFDYLQYKLQTSTPSELRNIHLVDEGIENLFIKKINKVNSMDEFIAACTSKRYSGARIKRTICHILLNTDKGEAKRVLEHKPSYIRVLASNAKGRKYLASIRKGNESNIILRFAAKDNPNLLFELKASNLYYLTKKSTERLEYQQKELKDFPIKL